MAAMQQSANPIRVNNTSTAARKSNQNIQVYLRVRPTNERERLIRSMEMVEVPSPREVVVKQTFESKMSKKFTFDRAFGPESKQADVYQSVVAPLIEEVLAGYNCTVFAYGQTGTGKTHTMVGDEIPTMVSSWEDDSQLGIIPRSLSHLFQELRLMGVEFSMRVSYLELYNEELCDLLSPSETTQIRIFDDANKKGSIIVQGLEEIPVHTTGDVYKLLAKGQEKRRMASTLMNAQSSRSHTIFSITVHIRENGIDGEELLKIGKLNLVDLAGSENLSKAGNEKGIRTRETVNINQSLLTLGRVITALVERTPHIPYRESKLTRLLQESLGGRTKTSIIATVSPGHKDLEETLSTLEYAHRAKNIQNRPEVNQKLTKKTVLKEYTEEIDRLKRDLMASRDKNGIYLAEETYQEMTFRLDSQNKDLNEKVQLIKALKEEMCNKQRIFTEVSMNLVEKAAELDAAQGKLAATAEALDQTKSALRTTSRRYQEKKHLVENHVHTEQVLTGQATALIGVVDEASTDTYRLQDTIDRRRQVDASIRQATEQHARGMDENLQQFGEFLAETRRNCGEKSASQAQELTAGDERASKWATEAVQKLGELGEGARQRSATLVANVQTRGAELQADCEAQRTSRTAGQRQLHEDLQAHLNRSDEKLIEIGSAVSDQRKTCAEFQAKSSEMHLSASDSARAFLTSHCAAERDLLPRVRQLVERHQLSNSALRSQIAANEARMSEMHAQMLRMYADIQSSNAAHTAQVEANASSVAELLALVTEHSEQSVEHCAKRQEAAADESGALSTVLEHWSNAVETNSATQTALVDSQRASNRQQRTDLDERLADTLAALDAEHARTAERLAQLQREVEQLQTAAATQTTADVGALVAGVQADAQRQCKSNTVCASLSAAIQRDLSEYGERVAVHVQACRSRLERFHRQELQTYRSTGETPAKREFVFSRQLAQTSPHERIVRRFWTAHEGDANMNMDCSVTICEGNESAFLDGITDEKSSSILLAAQQQQQQQLGAGAVDTPTLVLHPAVGETTTSSSTNSSTGTAVGCADGDDDDLGVQVLRPNGRMRDRSLSPSLFAGGVQPKRSASKSPMRRLNRSDESQTTAGGKRVGVTNGKQPVRLDRSTENKENVSS